MRQFDATFTRYDSKKAEMRVGSPEPVQAANFDAAFERCQDILRGLREADPERSYELHRLSGRHLSRAIACSGSRMFETLDELTARVSEGKA